VIASELVIPRFLYDIGFRVGGSGPVCFTTFEKLPNIAITPTASPASSIKMC
jgi:hypothetical protein